MKLGIISDCIHYKTPGGYVGTETHILLRQLEALSSYFSETIICCPFDKFSNNKVVTTYSKNNIQFLPVPNVGGNSITDKFKIIAALPKWLKAFKKVNAFSDIVYQRFPNNLNIPGFFFFYYLQKKVFATYTGPWVDNKMEAATYRFQKWLLKKYFKGPVWVYMNQEKLSQNIFGGFSPSYSLAEWKEETEQVELRITKIRNEGLKMFRLISVGTLDDRKNQVAILKACLILKKQDFPFYLKIVGDGPNYNVLRKFIDDNNLTKQVELTGKKNHEQVRELYRNSDFIVQSPLSEGFGKVPVEGFFHGVIPVLNEIDLAAHMTNEEERGYLFDASNESSLAETLLKIKAQTHLLPDMIMKGREFAQKQTLEAWAKEYYNTVTEYFEKK